LHASNAVEHWPAMQQESLHGEASEHDVVQVCVAASQASPALQSAATLHPQPPPTQA
jgi:hypothetical protein